MRHRFQFSVASLLIGTAVVAIAVNWWMLWQRVVAARHDFAAQTAAYEVGTATPEGVIQASKELLQAELAMPLVPSEKIAWLSYLDRTRELQRKVRAKAKSALWSSWEAMVETEQLANELLDECHSIEDRLELPHVGTEYFATREPRHEMDNERDVPGGDEPAPPAPDESTVKDSANSK